MNNLNDIASKTLDNTNISKHLGKSSQYKSTYDPSLLVREPRQSNRVHLNITDDSPPFVGYDIWNAYEFSCLCESGAPVTGVVKIVYSATNKYIVESKSLKLYLNSFNMEKFSGSTGDVVHKAKSTIANDLSSLLDTNVGVSIILSKNTPHNSILCDYQNNKEYITLENVIDVSRLECNIYSEDPKLLNGTQLPIGSTNAEIRYHSSMLKSNCRVTSQPDWGDVFLYYKGSFEIDPGSLLRYIISFREECHFHEEICETIYKRIWDRFQPQELAVTCLYVRRGGIDINPTRVSNKLLLSHALIDLDTPYIKTMRQ